MHSLTEGRIEKMEPYTRDIDQRHSGQFQRSIESYLFTINSLPTKKSSLMSSGRRKSRSFLYLARRHYILIW